MVFEGICHCEKSRGRRDAEAISRDAGGLLRSARSDIQNSAHPSDQDSSNDLTTGTLFGGDLSGTYSNLSVGDNSHLHNGTSISGLAVGNFSNPNISQWTNDSGYITTDTNSGGTVTGVSAGSGLTGGPITTTGTLSVDYTTLDSRYVNASDPGGDTMTGDLVVPEPGPEGGLPGTFAVGGKLRNHETRIAAVEGGGVPDGSVSLVKLKKTLAASGTFLCPAFPTETVLDQDCKPSGGRLFPNLTPAFYIPVVSFQSENLGLRWNTATAAVRPEVKYLVRTVGDPQHLTIR